MDVGEGRKAACWGYSDRPDRPQLGSVLDAYGERPAIDVEAVVRADAELGAVAPAAGAPHGQEDPR